MPTIMIYEDDELMRDLLESWLIEAGYRVVTAVSCAAGCGAAADLVIVSLFMPKQSGLQHVREVRLAHPGRPLIALSGQFHSSVSAAGAAAKALGVERVIAKPLARAELLEAVRGMIRATPWVPLPGLRH